MPRAKKNPVTDMPVVAETTPQTDNPGISEEIETSTASNVVPIRSSDTAPDSAHDWSDIDSVLSDVVNFS